MAIQIQIPFRKITTTIAFSLLVCLTTANAQVLQRVFKNFEQLKNISYQATTANKDLFSDAIFADTIKATETLLSKSAFRIKGNVQEDIYDGQKIFRLNYKDSTYRVSNEPTDSYYYYKSMSYLMNQFKKQVQKGAKVVQLKDSIYQGKSYFQLSIINLDSMRNDKKVYSNSKILIDKETFLLNFYRNDSQGFIDGTNIHIKIFNEYHFSNISVNDKNLEDLSKLILPTYFSVEKPKVELPLLAKYTPAPAMELSGLDGTTSNLDSYKGKIVLLNFTINGCPHCVNATEMLNNLTEKYKNINFAVVSVNHLDDKASISKFNKGFKQNYPTYTISKTDKDKYHVNGYPSFYLIDAKGEIVKGYEGFYEKLESEIIADLSAKK